MAIAVLGVIILYSACLFALAGQRDRASLRCEMVISMINGVCNAQGTAEQVRQGIIEARRRRLLP